MAADADTELETALEQVAHGAAVSVPSMVLERGLTLAFTAVLTNGFAVGAYGVFVLARRLQRYLVRLALGFRRGINRFLPNAESTAEREAVATFAAALLVGVASLFGAALYLSAPAVAGLVERGAALVTYLRVFAVGLPASVWLYTGAELLRGFEEVGPFNLVVRLGVPALQLAVGVVGVAAFDDLLPVAVGVVAASGAAGTATVYWVARKHGLRPRLRSPGSVSIHRRYLGFSLPLFLEGFATQTQRLGYYPLIVLFLSGTASGVFAVGVMLGGLVRLPLAGLNQFISPVAARLHEEGHEAALKRLYHVTSRNALVGVVGLAVPLVVYRRSVMALFGSAFVPYASLLPWFALAMVLAAATGSVGFLMPMTDNERALLAVNVVVTALLAVVAVPLTTRYGLSGLVATYLLMVALNNAFEVAVLYHLEDLQPFTRGHAKPVAAAVPLAAVTVGIRELEVLGAPLVGTLAGWAVYGGVLWFLGFDSVERTLFRTLLARYRTAVVRGATGVI